MSTTVTFVKIQTNEQIKELSILAREIWLKHFTPIIGADFADYMVSKFQSQEAITGDIQQDYAYEFVMSGEEKAGYISYKKENGKLFLSKYYLCENFRGLGIGATAMEYIVNICRKNDLEKIWLHCNRDNEHTLSVYKKFGFEITETLDREVGNGLLAEDYVLEKKIHKIKNIIFDMGNVLVTFKLEHIIGSFVDNQDDIPLVKQKLFKTGIWDQLDVGVSEATVISEACEVLPVHLHKAVANIIAYYPRIMPHKDNMPQLVKELKDNGYMVYLLSNVGTKFHEYCDDIKAITYMDGVIASADYKCKKPNPEIYQLLFDKFNLNPWECYFIDDLPANIKAGNRFGMSGHIFKDDIDLLRKDLSENGIL